MFYEFLFANSQKINSLKAAIAIQDIYYIDNSIKKLSHIGIFIEYKIYVLNCREIKFITLIFKFGLPLY